MIFGPPLVPLTLCAGRDVRDSTTTMSPTFLELVVAVILVLLAWVIALMISPRLLASFIAYWRSPRPPVNTDPFPNEKKRYPRPTQFLRKTMAAFANSPTPLRPLIRVGTIFVAAIVAMILLSFTFSAWRNINPGYVGIVFDKANHTVTTGALDPGWAFINPADQGDPGIPHHHPDLPDGAKLVRRLDER